MKKGILILFIIINLIIFSNFVFGDCRTEGCPSPKVCGCCIYGQTCLGYCCKCPTSGLNCACASTTCYTTKCNGGCCQGTMQPVCADPSTIQCGQIILPTNNCGTCPSGTLCSTGQTCVEGVCQSSGCDQYSDWVTLTKDHLTCSSPFVINGLPCVRKDTGRSFYNQFCLNNQIYDIIIG